MNDGSHTLPARRWTLFAIVAAALFVWTLALELPGRLAGLEYVRSEIAETQRRQAGVTGQSGILARLREERTELEQRLTVAADRQTERRGSAAVLDLIEDAAHHAQLALLELRPLEGERSSAYSRLPIRLRLLGSFDGVRTFLRTIETSRTTMPVREVQITAADPESAAVEATVLLDVVIAHVSASEEVP